LNAPNLWLLFQPQTCCTTVALAWGIVEVPKSETQVSADLWDEADTVNDLARALADYVRRRVVVVGTDDKELVVEPPAERRLDS
jgi:hypothetical protein